jgi:DtxR family Mn-dependent transcriptional regulator
VDALGLPWDEVHDEACRLEHALSPRVQDALEEFLDSPAVCPHGHPIPTSDLTVAQVRGVPLGSVAPGSEVRVVNVDETRAHVLGIARRLGLRPGASVRVQGAEESGDVSIVVDGVVSHLEGDVAARVLVTDEGTV